MLYLKKFSFPAACGLVLASAVAQGAQVVGPVNADQTVSQGASVSLEVQYDVTSPQSHAETGLGLRMHYNSSALTLDRASIEGSALKNMVSVGGTGMQDLQPIGDVEDDVEDLDNDPSTDKRIIIGWVDARATDELNDPNVRWPSGQSLPATLFTADFTASGSYTGPSTVNFTASSTSAAAGAPAEFVGNPAAVCIDGAGGTDCITIMLGDANGNEVVNILDVILILRHIGDPGGISVSAGADCNENGSINILDVICTLNHI